MIAAHVNERTEQATDDRIRLVVDDKVERRVVILADCRAIIGDQTLLNDARVRGIPVGIQGNARLGWHVHLSARFGLDIQTPFDYTN